MNNTFWNEALKAGTIIGIVSAAFSLIKSYVAIGDKTSLSLILSIVTIIVFVALVYAFTRRYSIMAAGNTGFGYGDGLGFVLASMLFTGVVVGLYSALANKLLFYDYVNQELETIFANLQDTVPDDTFDKAYSLTNKMVFNPLSLVVSNIISYLVSGGFVGLIVCGATRRAPQWTEAESDTDTEKQ